MTKYCQNIELPLRLKLSVLHLIENYQVYGVPDNVRLAENWV